jgi:hypothetical protein
MAKVLIDCEVVERNVVLLRQQAQIFPQSLCAAIANDLRDALTTAMTPRVSLVSYAALLNPSEVCNACWGTYGPAIHEQPLEPGSPPCECPCHGIKQREVAV